MMKQETLEYNLRQIILMENRVKLYKNNEISIKNFIDDIDALISWIQNPPSDLIQSLKSLLWEIEIIYSWALDQEKDLSSEEYEQISCSVNKIESLVLWYKKKYLFEMEDA